MKTAKEKKSFRFRFMVFKAKKLKKYFSYIVSLSFIGGGTRVPMENHWPVALSHWQTLSHNVVSSTPRMSGIRTHKFTKIQPPYDHDHDNDGPPGIADLIIGDLIKFDCRSYGPLIFLYLKTFKSFGFPIFWPWPDAVYSGVHYIRYLCFCYQDHKSIL